jgi:hypothetical protein
MPVPPYRAIAERHVCDRLLQANAVWPGNGQPLENLRGIEARALRRLLAADVIREERPDRYYLYAPAYAARMSGRRRRILIALLLVVFAGLLAALVGGSTTISLR